MKLAWGNRVSSLFRQDVIEISKLLGIDPSHLMACMAFETGKTFKPDISNAAGSGAIGLIQFMPQTAAALGTSTDELARMSALKQLEFVYHYFKPRAGTLKTLEDVYMAILWPAAIGKPSSHPIFRKNDPRHPKRYMQNAGLDFNKDGVVTKGEAAQKVIELLHKGLTPPYIYEVSL